MARTNLPNSFPGLKSKRFLAAAEALHKSIAGPLLAYHRELPSST
ncbi:hypothetical protein [Mesorhizobium sp. M0772]